MRIVVSDPEKGYGRENHHAVKRFAFEGKEHNRLWFHVIHYNHRALWLYLSSK